MLNQAAGDRKPYAELANLLAARGIISLRLDLRGHGESVNLGRFVPGALGRDPLIWDAESDVLAGYRFLTTHEAIDPAGIGVVAASYSGEEAAEAGRLSSYGALYVLLSPGSLSRASIDAMDPSGIPWLLVVAQDDPFIQDITESVRTRVPGAELLVVSGTEHATDLLRESDSLAERLSEWIADRLGGGA